MRASPALALGVLVAASAAAQDYGKQVPWDVEEAGSAAIMPGGNVQNARPVTIRTARPACFLAAGFPVIRALIEPADAVEQANLTFHPEGYPHWYQVAMRRSAEGFLAVLPKPRPSARRIFYRVEVVRAGRPREYGQPLSAPVVEQAADCPGAPAETVESAAIGVRVPKGAPMVPPVPPGFVPVGAVNLDKPTRGGKGKTPLIVAGGLAGVGAALFAAVPDAAESRAITQAESDEISFLDANPPPDSRFSLQSLPVLTVRMRVRSHRAIGPGNLRVILFRSFSGGSTGTPCAVLLGPHGGFPAGAPREVQVSGPLQNAMVCQPADRMRLAVEENDVVVISTGPSRSPDYPTRYFIDP
jgi:hypothetical protein